MRLDHQPSMGDVAQFLPGIASRGDECVQTLWDQLNSGEVHPHVVKNGDVPMALIGTRFLVRDSGPLGEIGWCTGDGAGEWFALIADLENWFRAAGCTAVRALCRPGWGKFLKTKAYSKTHEIWDKELT